MSIQSYITQIHIYYCISNNKSLFFYFNIYHSVIDCLIFCNNHECFVININKAKAIDRKFI